jgi:ubiquinone/menaquinone biosynthesis C-methylase UbiE
MTENFPFRLVLMNQSNHLNFAHELWSQTVVPGDLVIDATCGNGHDTLFLAKIALTSTAGTVYSIDIQPQAIESARKLLHDERVHFIEGSHETFPAEISPESVSLIVYNLGYLPGGDKKKTTMTETTLKSLQEAQKLIKKEGMISITCYPGHEEGKREEEMLLEYCSQLKPWHWTCCHHRWINRSSAPSLLILTKT